MPASLVASQFSALEEPDLAVEPALIVSIGPDDSQQDAPTPGLTVSQYTWRNSAPFTIASLDINRYNETSIIMIFRIDGSGNKRRWNECLSGAILFRCMNRCTGTKGVQDAPAP